VRGDGCDCGSLTLPSASLPLPYVGAPLYSRSSAGSRIEGTKPATAAIVARRIASMLERSPPSAFDDAPTGQGMGDAPRLRRAMGRYQMATRWTAPQSEPSQPWLREPAMAPANCVVKSEPAWEPVRVRGATMAGSLRPLNGSYFVRFDEEMPVRDACVRHIG